MNTMVIRSGEPTGKQECSAITFVCQCCGDCCSTMGRSSGDRSLPDLGCRTIWDIPVPDDEHWVKNVEYVFTRAGYRVIR